MDKLKKALSGRESSDEHEEERGNIISQVIEQNSLGYGTRVKWFAICFVLGFVFSFLGTMLMFFPGIGLMVFAVFYTIGNILAICSTFFLMGPVNQLKKMFSGTRVIASIVMIVALVLTLICAFVLGKTGLTLIMVVIQFLAMTWYALSYIPYARDAVKKCIGSCLDV